MASRTLRRGMVVVVATLLSTSCTVQPTADIAAAPAIHADRVTTASATPASHDVTRLSVHALAQFSGPANADGSLGSGCGAEEATALPDGSWFAFVSAIDVDELTVTADAACVFGTKSDPWMAYAAGLDEGEPSQDFVVANDVALDVDVAVSPEARLYLEADGWEPSTSAEAFGDGAEAVSAHQRMGVWLVVDEGIITAVVQPDFGDEE